MSSTCTGRLESSQDVFCTVGFLQARNFKTQKTKLAFVFVKAMVAPVKALSIALLEMQLALLASQLKEGIKSGWFQSRLAALFGAPIATRYYNGFAW